MKLSGHSDHSGEDDSIVPVALAEITLSATPQELRAMAEFLADCANEMDAMGAVYDHIHLSDRMKAFESSPHFVVVRG
jgi:hypothetical protein